MLGWANVVVVTGESVSMVSEACASGRHVVAVEPPLRRAGLGRPPKQRRLVRALAEQGYLHLHPLPEIGHSIRRCLSDRLPIRRLDSSTILREAVGRLL
jgi:hypothetical protein